MHLLSGSGSTLYTRETIAHRGWVRLSYSWRVYIQVLEVEGNSKDKKQIFQSLVRKVSRLTFNSINILNLKQQVEDYQRINQLIIQPGFKFCSYVKNPPIRQQHEFVQSFLFNTLCQISHWDQKNFVFSTNTHQRARKKLTFNLQLRYKVIFTPSS